MRPLLITLVLAAATTEARADLIGYNMTGTITNIQSDSPSHFIPLPVAVGDHITWTLQYDRSTPVSGAGPGWNFYMPNGPLIANIVDQTNGYHYFMDPGAPAVSILKLSSSALPNQAHAFSSSIYTRSTSFFVDAGYTTELTLGFNGSISTSQLANLQLNNIPLNLPASSFHYGRFVNVSGYSFTASVDTMSGPMVLSPEPGSFTLFFLGAAGFALRRLPLRIRWRFSARIRHAGQGE